MEATKKKMGRPVIGKPKTIEIKTRIDEDLEEKVKNYCEDKKITRSDFLRKAINKQLNEELLTDQRLQFLSTKRSYPLMKSIIS